MGQNPVEAGTSCFLLLLERHPECPRSSSSYTFSHLAFTAVPGVQLRCNCETIVSTKTLTILEDQRCTGRGDEKLGKVDDVIFDSDNGQIRYLVVDTRGLAKAAAGSWFLQKN